MATQIQPDVDDLENGAEEEGDTDSVKSEVKLGKLQFSLDYDFQEGKVSSNPQLSKVNLILDKKWTG